MPEKGDQHRRAAEHGGQPQRRRGLWSGTLAFGLVSIPVDLFVGDRTKGPSLHLIDETGTRLSRRYFCSLEERPLEGDEIVRGYEVEQDRFVLVDDEELAGLAPEKSREIDLKRFVPVAQLDPVFFERAYLLVPARDSIKAYRLLARTLEECGRAGIATFVMRDKEYLVAIIAEGGLLRAETLRHADEIRSPEAVGLPAPRQAPRGAIEQQVTAMQALAAEALDRTALRDPGRQRLLDLIERKRTTDTDVVARAEQGSPEAEDEDEPIDLMQVLKEGLEQGGPEPASDHSREAPTGSAGEPPEPSRAELYERAKALGIPGRSGMRKAQLAEAIRRADGGPTA